MCRHFKELTVNQFSGIQAYLARVYCEDTGYGENNYVQRCVSLSFYAHKLIAIMYDTVALFLIYKHVDGCSFFELMLQYVPVNDFSLLSGRFSVFLS